MSQAVRKLLPIIEAAPESPAAKGLLAVSTAVQQLVATCTGRRKEATKQSEEKQTRVLLSHPVFYQDPQASLPVTFKVPPPSNEAPRSKLWGITEHSFEDFSETELNPVASYGEYSS